jgi:hypothetical protein
MVSPELHGENSTKADLLPTADQHLLRISSNEELPEALHAPALPSRVLPGP